MANGFDKSAIEKQGGKQNPLEKRDQLRKQQAAEKTAKPKQDTKYKSVRIYPEDAKLLKRMAVKHDTTVVQLIDEACYDLKKKYEEKYGTSYEY